MYWNNFTFKTIRRVCMGHGDQSSLGFVQTLNMLGPFLLFVMANTSIIRQGAKRTFVTSLEVHYPKQLREAIVRAFMLKFSEMGLKVDHAETALHHAAKALTNQQAISMKLPPLVPVHKHRYVVFLLDGLAQWPQIYNFDEHHKLLHTVRMGEIVGTERKDALKKRILEELLVWKVHFSWDSFTAFEG